MIVIKEVTNKKLSKLFTTFPTKLYKNNPYYVPPLDSDEIGLFDPKVYPGHEYVDAIRFLAYKDNQIVGRIAGLVNNSWNLEHNKKYARFTRIDMIDDINVTEALINSVTAWAKLKGMDTLIGPIGFSDLDRQGMLVEGFEELSMFITIYNFPYYNEHLTKLGFVKDADWIEKRVTWPKETPEKLTKTVDMIKRRYGYELIKLKSKKELAQFVPKAFEVYNTAFRELYGFYPVTYKVIDFYLKHFYDAIQLDYLWIVKDDQDEIAAFGLVIPSLAKASQKSRGRMLPFGWLRFLRALKKNDVLEFLLIAIEPQHQNKGVLALIFEDGFRQGIKNGVKYAETGPELEVNIAIQNQWKMFETETHKRRRCYIKSI